MRGSIFRSLRGVRAGKLELSLELSLFFCLEGSKEYKDFFGVSRASGGAHLVFAIFVDF